jgi:hypothetical protein
MFLTPTEIAIFGAIYFFIGIWLGTIGPVGKDISKEVERARGTPFTNAVMERKGYIDHLLSSRILFT